MFQQVGSKAYKEGLDNTLLLDRYFGHPHRQYKTIHVAGTNGKGSCCHTIAAILHTHFPKVHGGKPKVGLYTSPHLIDFRERIRIIGQGLIPEDYVARWVEENKPFFDTLHCSFFELTTALAFKYFADAGVDIAVIETGLGGRLDCTNIITPILSVITNISLDHTQFLGDTLAKIAAEKAGIIKAGVPVVIGETTKETRPVFQHAADAVGAPIIYAEVIGSATSLVEEQTVQSLTDNIALKGSYQEKNMRTVITAMRQILGQDIADKAFSKPLPVAAITGLHGRWENVQPYNRTTVQPYNRTTVQPYNRTTVQPYNRRQTESNQVNLNCRGAKEEDRKVNRKTAKHPLVICDTGHNIGGWQYLARQIAQTPCRHHHIILGFVRDKDVRGILQLIATNLDGASFYFTKASIERAMNEDDLLQTAQECGLDGKAYPSVSEAYRAALAAAHQDDFIFIGGSTFIVADLMKLVI